MLLIWCNSIMHDLYITTYYYRVACVPFAVLPLLSKHQSTYLSLTLLPYYGHCNLPASLHACLLTYLLFYTHIGLSAYLSSCIMLIMYQSTQQSENPSEYQFNEGSPSRGGVGGLCTGRTVFKNSLISPVPQKHTCVVAFAPC